MQEKNISIILPVYNSEKTIKRTIDSLLQQDYENYEIIIINDGSSDNSDTICNKYKEKYKNIKYYYINNHGVSHARNYGINKAEGDYIMFIDSDDEYMSDTLKSINEVLYKKDYDWVVFGYERIHVDNNNKMKLMQTKQIELNEDIDKKNFVEKLQQNFLFNQIWNKVYKKSVIKKINNIFDEGISSGEDYRFNLKYIEHIQKAIYIEKILYKYYSATTGLSLREKNEKIYIKLKNLKEHKKFYERQGYNLQYIDKNYIYICFSGLTSMVDGNNNEQSLNNIKKYIQNREIHRELLEIKNRAKGLKNKILINLLLIQNPIVLKGISKCLIIIRKLYRKIRLG